LLTKTIRSIQDETCALYVKSIIDKKHDISEREKLFLFNYLREGNIPDSMRIVANNKDMNLRILEKVEDYKTNVFVIVESFFTYGFIPELLEL